jgi:predicted dehydrogenase
MHHFARCVRGKESPQSTGEDGRLVQEVLCAGYQSAGQRAAVSMPFRPKGVQRPIDLWLKNR